MRKPTMFRHIWVRIKILENKGFRVARKKKKKILGKGISFVFNVNAKRVECTINKTTQELQPFCWDILVGNNVGHIIF